MKDEGFLDPPRVCVFCGAPRTGIQVGEVYFACGTIFLSAKTGVPFLWKVSCDPSK